MAKLNRREFLKLGGQGTAVLGMGLTGSKWGKTGKAWAAAAPEGPMPQQPENLFEANKLDFRPNWDEWEFYYPGKYDAEDTKVLNAWHAELDRINKRGDINIKDLISGKLEGQPGIGRTQNINAESMKRLADSYGDRIPRWTDPDYAKKTKYGYCAMPWIAGGQIGVPAMPKDQGIGDYMVVSNYNVSPTYYKPIYEGDTIYTVTDKSDAIDITPTQGSFYRTFCLIGYGRCYNQKGELVAEGAGMRTESFRRHKDKAKRNPYGEHRWESPDWYTNRPVHQYTDEDWEEIKNIWKNEEIRGSKTRYWDDVKIGDMPTPTAIGPFISEVVTEMTGNVSQWVVDAKYNIMDPKIFKTMKKNFQGIYVPPEYLVKKLVSVGQDRGNTTSHGYLNLTAGDGRSVLMNMIGAYWAGSMILKWMGDDGWLQRFAWAMMEWPQAQLGINYQEDPTRIPLTPLHLRAANKFEKWPYLLKVPSMNNGICNWHGMEGDLCISKAYVYDKYQKGSEYFVDLIWWCETFDRHIIEEGFATVKLPKK